MVRTLLISSSYLISIIRFSVLPYFNQHHNVLSGGDDYGQVTNMPLGPFGNSNRIQCFNVTIVDDNVPEDNEEFMTVVTFCPGELVPPNTIITPPNSTVTIGDNDRELFAVHQPRCSLSRNC